MVVLHRAGLTAQEEAGCRWRARRIPGRSGEVRQLRRAGATEFAVREFAKAGIQLRRAVGVGAVRGLDDTLSKALASYGLDLPLLRYFGMGLAGLVLILSSMVIVGLPIRWIFRPVFWMFRPVGYLLNKVVERRALAESVHN